jgi:hypothetical protein
MDGKSSGTESAGDLRVARKIASGSAVVIREYIDEMRKQGKNHWRAIDRRQGRKKGTPTALPFHRLT